MARYGRFRAHSTTTKSTTIPGNFVLAFVWCFAMLGFLFGLDNAVGVYLGMRLIGRF